MNSSAYLLLSGEGTTSSTNMLHPPLYMKGGLLYDQTGMRRIMFDSDFCLQRFVADYPAKAVETVSSTANAGRQGVRYCYLGPSESEEAYDGYWKDRIIPPAMAKETLVPTVRMLADAGLMSHIFGSWNFGGVASEEIAFHEWMGDTLRREGLAKWIFYEWRNEWNLTSPYGGGWDEDEEILGSPETYRVARECIAIMKRELGCVCSMGSPGEDDPTIGATITKTGAEIAGLDFGRGYTGDLMMKHAHRGYYDGRFKGRYKGAALWVLEPAGPDSIALPHDAYLPLSDPAYLFGMHAIYALTGQAASYFNGPAVRHYNPIDTTPGFYEHPKLFHFFPENIGGWIGPTWFLNPDNRKEFYNVVAEEWFLIEHPPAPFKKWEVLFHDGSTLQGTTPAIVTGLDPNTSQLRPGWKACAIHGEFA